MKAGILTYHFAKNYGAVLQCFALQKELQNRGIDVFVLDYVSQNQFDNNVIYSRRASPRSVLKNVVLLPFHVYRKRRFDAFNQFVKNKLVLTNRLTNLEQLQHEADAGYDVLISGSDQVFNPHIPDFEDAFLFPFETTVRKTSFAASLGPADAEILRPYQKQLQDFSYIAVREQSAVSCFEKLGICVDSVVADPVLLLSREEWLASFEQQYNLPKEPYLLCYFLNAEHTGMYLQHAQRIAAEKGLKLVNILTRYRTSCFSKGAKLDTGPEEFLQLLANAQYVCTDSFHGTAFSIIMNVDFSSFVPSRQTTDQRKQHLTQCVGLNNRIVYADDPHFFLGPISYSAVNEKLKDIRNDGKHVLTELLSQHVEKEQK